MSSKFGNDDVYIADTEKLLQLGRMCKELRSEKDILKEALLKEKSKNAELIQRLESSANAASETRLKDKKYIEELERELKNCSQEIGYLQNQLNLRNVESNCIGEQVHSLELKLTEVGSLHEKLRLLSEKVIQSDSRELLLMREIKVKEEELHKFASHVEELESAISTISLESQCEIESMRLDITSLEEKCFEAERFSREVAQEKARVDVLLEEFESQYQEAHEKVCFLEMENKELKEKLVANKINARRSCSKFPEHLETWLKYSGVISINVPTGGGSIEDFLLELRQEFPLLKEICNCEEVLCSFVSKPATVTALDDNVKEEMENMSNKIHEFELQVAQLKDELRREKLKAKEEAEDLTQAMAELRYQITDMLEVERKRRACIEQTSLRRIQDLEEQVRKEQRKSSAAIQHFQEAHELAEMRAMKVRHLKHALEGFRWTTDRETTQIIESCSCRNCNMLQKNSHVLTEALEDDEASKFSCEEDFMNQVLIEWYPDDEAPSADGS